MYHIMTESLTRARGAAPRTNFYNETPFCVFNDTGKVSPAKTESFYLDCKENLPDSYKINFQLT